MSEPRASAPSLRFLGTSDSQGVPRWWCACPVCHDARAGGGNARSRPSVLLTGGRETILIDAAPELRNQLADLHPLELDAALITHAHNDHLLGLGDLADMARWTGTRLPIYAPTEVVPQLAERFGYLTRGGYPERVPFLTLEAAGRSFGGYRVEAVRVPHGFNGWAYGLRFEGPTGAWGYLPDSLDLDDLAPWRGLDLLVLGTSFPVENAPKATRSVHDMREAEILVRELTPARTVLTHLSHGVDVRQPPPSWARFAHDGMMLRLP